jgi:hypothetical protein
VPFSTASCRNRINLLARFLEENHPDGLSHGIFDKSQSIHISQLRYDGKIGIVATNFCKYIIGENRLIQVEEVAA